jgi:hypothetical protein
MTLLGSLGSDGQEVLQKVEKPKQNKFFELKALSSLALQIERFVQLLQPWLQFPLPWIWILVPPNNNTLSLETTINHHNVFTMQCINQHSTP